jgi:hypothetical protein
MVKFDHESRITLYELLRSLTVIYDLLAFPAIGFYLIKEVTHWRR